MEMVQTPVTQDASNFVENALDARHEVDGIGMPDDIEAIISEMGEVAHVALHGFDGYTIVRCRFPVSLQLGIGKIIYRYVRAQQRKCHRLLAASTGETKYPFAS